MKKSLTDNQKGIRILEKILCSEKSSREKKLLAMIGLVSMARRGG